MNTLATDKAQAIAERKQIVRERKIADRTITIERKSLRATYAKNGGRF
jgi:hypothetical protein